MKLDLQSISRREREDVVTLATSFVAVVVVWLAWMGWRPDMVAGRHDIIFNILPLLLDLFEQGGDWTEVAYRAHVEGGIKVADQMGVVPVFAWCARLGLSPVTAVNLLVFMIQTIIAYASCVLVRDLGPRDAAGASRMSWTLAPFVAVLSAFAPFLGWKLGYGHVNVVMGGLPFLVGAMLLVAAARKRITLTTAAVAVVALAHGYDCVGHQVKLYSLVFGAPLLVALLFRSRITSEHRLAGGILLAPLLMAMPRFTSMLAHARGSDASRSIGGENVIFEYVTATARDWLTGIPWGHEFVSYQRDSLLHHETNYPLGPLLLFLPFLVPARGRGAAVLGALAFLVIGPMLFSMNALGFADLLAAIVPPLESFRVPERAIVPACLIMPAFAVAALRRLARSDEASLGLKDALFGVTVLVAISLLPSVPREVIAWAAAFAWLTCRNRAAAAVQARLVVALVAVFAGAGLASFEERSLPLLRAQSLLENAERAGRRLKYAHPGIGEPLARVNVPVNLVGAGNSFRFFGFASIDGYFNPPRRFLLLFCAAHGIEFNPTINSLSPGIDKPGTRLLGRLYNVVGTIGRDNSGLRVTDVDGAVGPAWFSSRIESVPDVEALVGRLARAGDGLVAAARDVVWVDASDAAVAAAVGAKIDQGDRPSLVRGVRRLDDGQSFVVEVETAATRPLTMAMNFTENLRAFAVEGAERRELEVFPAYGALLGVVVPAGTGEILVEARPVSAPWSGVAWWIGLLLTVTVVGWPLRYAGRDRSADER